MTCNFKAIIYFKDCKFKTPEEQDRQYKSSQIHSFLVTQFIWRGFNIKARSCIYVDNVVKLLTTAFHVIHSFRISFSAFYSLAFIFLKHSKL